MLGRQTMHLQWSEIGQILAILENSRLITFIFSFGVILGPKTSMAFNMFVLAQVFLFRKTGTPCFTLLMWGHIKNRDRENQCVV